MKYLLFVFGDVDEPEIFNEIIYNIKTITKDYTNSINKQKSLILYVDSELTFDNLDFFLLKNISHLVDFYFLFSASNKFAENLDFESREHLFQEDGDAFLIDEFEDEDDFNFQFNQKAEPKNLDKILEKIKHKGIKSLTQDESKFLESYSK